MPGYWPWTQALGSLTEIVGVPKAKALASDDADLLAAIVPALGDRVQDDAGGVEQASLVLFDAVCRWLARLARLRPALVVLDDLQWADQSSLSLLDFVTRSLHSAPLLIVGAHRSDELDPTSRPLLAGVATRGDHIPLEGLSLAEVCSLVADLAGEELASAWGTDIHRRTGGHPFFVRELASLIEAGDEAMVVPAAIRDAIVQRVARADDATHDVLQAAAVVGDELQPDVLAAVLGVQVDEIEDAIASAAAVGVVAPSNPKGRFRFAHDLFRETLYDELTSRARTVLHQKVAVALADRAERGADTSPGEVARHFAAAIVLAGPDRALRWAFAAAADERAGMAFYEAAVHLSRVRLALTDAGASIPEETWTDLLVAEADAVARSGDPHTAKQLLVKARTHARRCDDGSHVAAVAFGMQRLGARFAMARPELLAILAEARKAVSAESATWARLTAAMARELEHSVAEDRRRAPPLSEEALHVARRIGDPATLAVCLLAHHDVLWTPGWARQRRDIAEEIVSLAAEAGDEEQRAEGLLLLANALLEDASPAFRAALERYLNAMDTLGQPRHRYMAMTRRAALALLDGHLDDASVLIQAAASYGERIGEPDAGNVRISQRLELIRARGAPDEQRTFADEALDYMSRDIPAFAHAVAAAFLARAGDLRRARRHVTTAVVLGSWKADRSYLSSVFVGNLTAAATVLADSELCTEILEELRPLATSCAVHGAIVAFSGSHAHHAGLAAAALGRTEVAVELLRQAVDTHQRLGAAVWEAESRTALARVCDQQPTIWRRDGS
jgi:tetratricopeptide (TPR) repeat protein